MLDLRFIRAEPDRVREAMRNKGDRADLDRVLTLDEERRDLLVTADGLKHERNRVSEEIGRRKRSGEGDPADLMKEMREVAGRVKGLDLRLSEVEAELDRLLLTLPNIPHPSVPVGPAAANEVVRAWGEKPDFPFTPRPHWDLLETGDMADFGGASKLSGSGFALFRGAGAALSRALITFMLDVHVREHGYTEVAPPYLVQRACMQGTGQLPKMEEDMYVTSADDLFLIPTAEVPLTNLHRDEILEAARLPIRYTAHTPCFRREAGAYGKDTRGLNRVHQFDKVELVRLVEPENSYQELESLVGEAETILQRLEIPYRVVLLATGDLSFAAAKCYDLEVWSPGQDRWLEASSCSNFEEFQARRLGTRYRPAAGEKPRFVHTLNGSAVALPRTIVALLENHQQADGSIRVPQALRPYLGGRELLP